MKKKHIHDMYEHICKVMQECQGLMWNCTHDENGRLNDSQEGYLTILDLFNMVDNLHSRLYIIRNHLPFPHETFLHDVHDELITDEDFAKCN